MIDFALEAERTQGMSPRDAIVQACLLRFRPIMMTTLAALFGALPLALESGTGSELRIPLGISIIGGLLLSQLLTLYTTPVIYLALERLNRKIEKAVPRPRSSRRRRSPGPPRGCSRWHRSRSPSSAGRSAPRCWRSACSWSASSPIVFLPVASLPTSTSRRSGSPPAGRAPIPTIMAATVAAPLERRLGEIAGVTEITSTSSLGSTSIQLQFDHRPQHRRRRARRAGRDQRRAGRPAERPAVAAALPQGQSGGRAGPDPGADLEDAAAERDVRRRRHRDRPAHLAGRRASARSASAAPSSRRCAIARQPGRARLDAASRIDDVRTADRQRQPAGPGRHLRRRRAERDDRRPTSRCAPRPNSATSSSRASSGNVVRLVRRRRRSRRPSATAARSPGSTSSRRC